MSNEPLNLEWAFGFSKDSIGSVHSLCSQQRNAIFMISSHSGVIYDFEHRSQSILQGHCYSISACAVDHNKRWIVTADAGLNDSIMIIWDAMTFVPVKTITAPHATGICAIDISDDALHIATLSSSNVSNYNLQEIAIWSWTTDDNQAILREKIDCQEFHHSVKFNPKNKSELITSSNKFIFFWSWDELTLQYYNGKISKVDLGHFSGNIISCIFLPSAENAVTATSDGFVITWEGKNETTKIPTGKFTKTAKKLLKLVDSGIRVMETTDNNYLMLGCSDGAVRFYDYFLRLEAWFEDLSAGPVCSVSFSLQACPYPVGEGGSPGLRFWVPDFIVGTSHGFIVGIESAIFEEIRKEDRRGTLLMQGVPDEVSCVVCHPSRPLVVVTCLDGVIQVWNYEMKLLMNIREFNARGNITSSGNDASGGVTMKTRTGKLSDNLSYFKCKCAAFDPSGTILAIGFASGTIKLLIAESLEDFANFTPSSDSIDSLKFDATGTFLSGYDSGHHVFLFKRDDFLTTAGGSKKSVASRQGYTYIGRSLSHTAPVVDVAFGFKDSGHPTLISVGEDRYCVEYDLERSSVPSGIICVKCERNQIESEEENKELSINNDATPSVPVDDADAMKANDESKGDQPITESQVVAKKYDSVRVESSSLPKAMMWYPHQSLINGMYQEDVEDRFLIATDEFKLKEYNVVSKECRKTTLSPRFGGAVTKLLMIPDVSMVQLQYDILSDHPSSQNGKYYPADGIEGDRESFLKAMQLSYSGTYYAFTTSSRVIGMGSFPLNGNPAKTTGIVAHPSDISAIAVSYDGKYIFSSGAQDLSVNMWRVDTDAFEQQLINYTADLVQKRKMIQESINEMQSNGEDVEKADVDPQALEIFLNEADVTLLPFFNLMEGGEGGELHRDIIDFFGYCQMKDEDNDVIQMSGMKPMQGKQDNIPYLASPHFDPFVKGTIPVDELPSLFRAVGFYPTEEEISNFTKEVKYKYFMTTGEIQYDVNLSEAIQLYLNHRPVIPLNRSAIIQSIDKIIDCYAGQLKNEPTIITWNKLKYCLMNEGEKLSLSALDAYLVALIGGDSSNLPDNAMMNSAQIADQILGFEETSESVVDDMN